MSAAFSSENFASGAARLAALWERLLPSEPSWRWVPARQPFAVAMGGGYLSTQRGLLVEADCEHASQDKGPAVPTTAPLLASTAGHDGSSSSSSSPCSGPAAAPGAEGTEASVEELEAAEDEGEADPADARQHLVRQQHAAQEQQQRDQQQLPQQQEQQGCHQQRHQQDRTQQQGWQQQGWQQRLHAGRPAGPASSAGARLALTCHVVYHLSYCVPVLYFEVSDQSSAPVGLDALLAALPRLRAAAASGQPGTVITQEEHPFLHRPFLMLHPCQTGAIMELLLPHPSGAAAEMQPAAGAGAAAVRVAALQAAQAAAAERTAAAAAAPQSAHEAAAAAAQAAAQEAASERALCYLLAWLSVAGQPLGLAVPADMWWKASAGGSPL